MNIGPHELHDLTMFSLSKTQFPPEFTKPNVLMEEIAREYAIAQKNLKKELQKNGITVLDI